MHFGVTDLKVHQPMVADFFHAETPSVTLSPSLEIAEIQEMYLPMPFNSIYEKQGVLH